VVGRADGSHDHHVLTVRSQVSTEPVDVGAEPTRGGSDDLHDPHATSSLRRPDETALAVVSTARTDEQPGIDATL
jgi:hypothetical protein